MQSAGDLLRQQRLKLKLTFTQVADLTKIPVKTLRAIEKNRFADLPGATYSQGFIKNYAAVLKLDSQLVLAVWRRDFNKLNQKSIMPTGLAKPLTPASAASLTKPIVSITNPPIKLGRYRTRLLKKVVTIDCIASNTYI